MVIARDARNAVIEAALVEVAVDLSLVNLFASRSETVLRLLNRDSELRHVIVRQRWQGLSGTCEMPFRRMHRRGREH